MKHLVVRAEQDVERAGHVTERLRQLGELPHRDSFTNCSQPVGFVPKTHPGRLRRSIWSIFSCTCTRAAQAASIASSAALTCSSILGLNTILAASDPICSTWYVTESSAPNGRELCGSRIESSKIEKLILAG